MFVTFIISAILLIIGILIMGFRIFFIKNGEFPNIHIGGNKGLKEQGVHCATTQDRDAHNNKPRPMNNEDLIQEITKKF